MLTINRENLLKLVPEIKVLCNKSLWSMDKIMNSPITKQFIICPEICLSLATFPFMLTLALVDSFTQGLTELGQASEEIFRGDRLPVIQLDGKDKGQRTKDKG